MVAPHPITHAFVPGRSWNPEARKQGETFGTEMLELINSVLRKIKLHRYPVHAWHSRNYSGALCSHLSLTGRREADGLHLALSVDGILHHQHPHVVVVGGLIVVLAVLQCLFHPACRGDCLRGRREVVVPDSHLKGEARGQIRAAGRVQDQRGRREFDYLTNQTSFITKPARRSD